MGVEVGELWETTKHAIVAYTGMLLATFFTVLALVVTFYYVVSGFFQSSPAPRRREMEFEPMEPLPPSVQCGEFSKELSPTTALIRRSPCSWPSRNHQLLQKAAVSRTAKGKGKSAPLLKCSSIPKKKPSSSADGAAATSRGCSHNEAIECLTRMADSCLNAPTPLRHVSPKQRHHEAKHEKLGLIDKDRQYEIDLAKACAKSNAQEELVIIGTPGLDLITLGLVDAEAIPKYDLAVEDRRRLTKEYSRVLTRKHQAWQAAEI